MTRQIKRMSYEDAVREFDEATQAVDKAWSELRRAQRRRTDAQFNLYDALARKNAGPPKQYTSKEPPE